MKQPLPLLCLALAAAGGLWLAAPATAPAQSGDDPAVVSLMTDVVAQQAAILENQTKIDEKIATIAEDVRQARLFAARGGK